MRTPKEALEEIKRNDPGTGVTLHNIRVLIKTGAVPSVPVGNGARRLVNLDMLMEYLKNPPETPPAPLAASANIQPVRGIRRIRE